MQKVAIFWRHIPLLFGLTLSPFISVLSLVNKLLMIELMYPVVTAISLNMGSGLFKVDSESCFN